MARLNALRLMLLVVPLAIAGCMTLPVFPDKVNHAIGENNIFWSEFVPMWLCNPETREWTRELRRRKTEEANRLVEETMDGEKN